MNTNSKEYIIKFSKLLSTNPNIKKINSFIEKHLPSKKDRTEKELFQSIFKPIRHLQYSPYTMQNLNKLIATGIYQYLISDFDYITLISGTEGKGKSTLTIQLIYLLKKLGIDWNFENLIMRTTNIERALKSLTTGNLKSVWFDEAKIYFDKRESMTRKRIQLLQEITTQRARNTAYFLCIGDVDEIDKYFRERRIRSVIIIPDRKIYFHLLNLGIFGMGEDRFRLDYFNYILRTFSYIDYTQQLNILGNLPSTHGIGLFTQADKIGLSKEWKIYQNYKNMSMSYSVLQKELMNRKKIEDNYIKKKIRDMFKNYKSHSILSFGED